MAGLGNVDVKEFIIEGKTYSVVGCYDSDTPEGTFDFYDIYDELGQCLNEGDPFYELPTKEEVTELVEFRELD